jgi:transcriptional regulator NrdR family protein
MVSEIKQVECEKCGCRDTEIVDSYMGESTHQCNHCGSKTLSSSDVFSDVAAVFQTTKCPFCESKNNKITRGPQVQRDGRIKRFHKCGNCRNTFPSYEDRDG